MPFTLILIVLFAFFISHFFKLPVEHCQSGIHSDSFHQLLVCPDGYGKFWVKLLEHDRGHFVLVRNRPQPPVFLTVFMPLHSTGGKQHEEYKSADDGSPDIRVLVPTAGEFVPK